MKRKDPWLDIPEDFFLSQDDKDFIAKFGREEWLAFSKKRDRFFIKKQDALRERLIKAYEEKGNKSLLPWLASLGVPVDYSPDDYR
jgi:hypothetical protein